MFDDVLVPTDGSACARAAVGYAGDLADRYGARVHVLCVADSRTFDSAPHRERMENEREAVAERARTELSEGGIAVDHAVRVGVPYEAILDYAAEADVDLVVMGTHGRTGVERYLLGSVTEKVVRLSDAPVLTVKSEDDGGVTYPYTDVLVPTDGSEGAEAAIDPAVDVARTYDARVHALSVIDTMAMGVDVRSAAILDALEESARSAVESVEAHAARASVSAVETEVRHGNPYRAIRSYVDDHDVDLVVMGTHGRSGVERYLLGSVAEKTVRTSPVPVMTVRRPA